MPRSASPPLHIARLQRIVGESITDPAALSAIDRMRKRLKQKRRGHATTKNGHRAGTNSASRKRR